MRPRVLEDGEALGRRASRRRTSPDRHGDSRRPYVEGLSMLLR